ncbi:MAG: poly-beta-1,6-N-acetyl-D-glucosamine N-deacetylase PgaB, partial [Gammaproteobacteria bacterium]|nr:poly-beta-1,6-N-acetyl-D-glucosamine N-deacetylase PgaB [Gammaproteobacteria bacterium]
MQRARRALTPVVLLAAFASVATPVAAPAQQSFDVIAYHDVRDDVSGNYDPDQYAISTANLIDHFTWLGLNGYNVISVDDLLAARRGERELPDQAVLLTFDDGLKSVATHVLPLLELFD